MISIKELHSVNAWRYLMESVTDGRGDLREPSTITRYYAEAGTPPGRWMGSGLAGLGNGDGLTNGSLVSGGQMELLFGQGRDPITGEKLGRGFRQPPSYQERVDARTRALPRGMSRQARAIAVKEIRSEERLRRVRHAVAGFDFTFSPPKSVSVMWAIADRATRDQITAAHQAAISDVLKLIERDVARTRVGTDGVAQVRTRGIVATAFDHYDSREHDPQLHTHLVIANRVQTDDGRWRTLDSRGMIFPSVVAMSETYDTLLADEMTRRLGVSWEIRDTGRKLKNAKWEIAGIPDELLDHFSQRRAQIDVLKGELVAEYRERTGREPDDATILKLRQQATWKTRREKTLYPLATLAEYWRRQASAMLGMDDLSKVVASVVGRQSKRHVLRADDIVSKDLDALVDEVLARLHESRSTWTHWNIRAEAARATMKYRTVDSPDRDAVLQRLSAAVEERSVLLGAPPLATTPASLRRPDGSSQFEPEFSAIYTSQAIVDAEARLLDAATAMTAPRVDETTLRKVIRAMSAGGQGLDEDQAAAVFAVASSSRCLDVLVGPAGSGKTATLSALRAVWEAQHGAASMVGLAPTARAAEVLADALDIPTENTAKWLIEHSRNTERRGRLRQMLARPPARRPTGRRSRTVQQHTGATAVRDEIARWELHPGQLLIIDEASMSGTLALDRLTTHARAVGAKVLLAGDWAQLSAVESGGALRMLVNQRTDVPELSTVRRFANRWERTASVRLRTGDLRAIDDYVRRDRIRGGAAVDMMMAAYDAWTADEKAGKSSLLVADTNAVVSELNARARADRADWGLVEADGHRLHDGTLAGVGDRIVTRAIDRTLRTGRSSWVKNGDQWVVVNRSDDGALTVRRAHSTFSSAITLPAAYVAADVELAYATTAHRSQGVTVDTTHALVRPEMYRELLYVAMTRAHESNIAYVCTDTRVDDEPGADEELSVREVLKTVLSRSGADVSAHETMRAEQERVGSIAQLAAEYDTIAREARREHWNALAQLSFPDADVGDITRSPSWPGLVVAWRNAEAAGLDLDTAAPPLAASLPTAGDPLAVLRDRVEQWHTNAGSRTERLQSVIAGLIPRADDVTDPEMRRALDERAALIEQRASALVTRAIADEEPWVARLGPPPSDPHTRLRWEKAVTTVAAYRDRHGVTDIRDAFGEPRGGGQWTLRSDRRRAVAAANEARRLAEDQMDAKGRRQLVTLAKGRQLARDL